jgi:nucleoside-diphosphate-sugar epimerase
VKRREDPLDVWSDTERDFIHVDDVVGACLAMVERGVFGPVNIGTGIPTRMTQLARMAAEAVGYEPEIRVLGRSAGPDHRYADIGAMREFYAPRVDLREGIERALCGSHLLETA